MDFSSGFVALRDRMEQGYDAAFTSRQNVVLEGRTAALMSVFSASSERKILGVMSTGSMAHAHEYRLLFAQPSLDEQSLGDWWSYALRVERALVKPDAEHSFTLVSLVLVCADMEKTVQKKLKKLVAERQYDKGRNGWSSIRLAVIDLTSRKLYANPSGDTLKNVLKPLL